MCLRDRRGAVGAGRACAHTASGTGKVTSGPAPRPTPGKLRLRRWTYDARVGWGLPHGSHQSVARIALPRVSGETAPTRIAAPMAQFSACDAGCPHRARPDVTSPLRRRGGRRRCPSQSAPSDRAHTASGTGKVTSGPAPRPTPGKLRLRRRTYDDRVGGGLPHGSHQSVARIAPPRQWSRSRNTNASRYRSCSRAIAERAC